MSAEEIESLRQALAAQRELQREADHRVKNNLQLISSLVMLHGRRTADEGARQALKAVQQRVTAVSAAHRYVTRERGSEQVDLAALVRELAGDLAAAAGREGIAISLDLEPVFVGARDAAPLALILNEALGNALAHAFPDARPGRIAVTLRDTDGGFELAVADDGVGQAGAAPGFGRTILQLLSQQLRARLEITDAQPGLRVAVSVPTNQAQP
ncbi:sensor histidine kinase [Phenylobacterium sp. VNQ135]|uniref:sensor histidine kinase n=1 Tax=Phenylobacterium sp. VNQ135 TaxID=3400922 RepID=UPI003C0074F1